MPIGIHFAGRPISLLFQHYLRKFDLPDFNLPFHQHHNRSTSTIEPSISLNSAKGRSHINNDHPNHFSFPPALSSLGVDSVPAASRCISLPAAKLRHHQPDLQPHHLSEQPGLPAEWCRCCTCWPLRRRCCRPNYPYRQLQW